MIVLLIDRLGCVNYFIQIAPRLFPIVIEDTYKADHQIQNKKQIKPTVKPCKIYYNRAEVYIELNKFEEALKDLEKAISINKSFSDAYYLISVIFRTQKKYKKAIKYLKKVLETNGEDYIAYYDIYKLYNILIKHEKDETKKEKYLNIANKSLKKSANLGYEKAINQLK